MMRQVRFAAPLLLSLLLAACQGAPQGPSTREIEEDYRLKHPLTVEPATALLQLQALPPDQLSDPDRRRLHDFAQQFIRRGNGIVDVSVGGQGANDGAARAFGQRIAQDLLEEGLKTGELRLQMVINDPATPPGAGSLRFATSQVNVPSCRDWSEGDRNAPHANFGCALQHNIGVMLADPRDLERPRDGATTHSAVGDAAIDKMNRGLATWSVPLPLSATTKSTGGSSGGQ